MEAILGGVAFVGLFPALLVIRALLARDLGAFDSCAPLWTGARSPSCHDEDTVSQPFRTIGPRMTPRVVLQSRWTAR
jgi:hypothetical protein